MQVSITGEKVELILDPFRAKYAGVKDARWKRSPVSIGGESDVVSTTNTPSGHLSARPRGPDGHITFGKVKSREAVESTEGVPQFTPITQDGKSGDLLFEFGATVGRFDLAGRLDRYDGMLPELKLDMTRDQVAAVLRRRDVRERLDKISKSGFVWSKGEYSTRLYAHGRLMGEITSWGEVDNRLYANLGLRFGAVPPAKLQKLQAAIEIQLNARFKARTVGFIKDDNRAKRLATGDGTAQGDCETRSIAYSQARNPDEAGARYRWLSDHRETAYSRKMETLDNGASIADETMVRNRNHVALKKKTVSWSPDIHNDADYWTALDTVDLDDLVSGRVIRPTLGEWAEHYEDFRASMRTFRNDEFDMGHSIAIRNRHIVDTWDSHRQVFWDDASEARLGVRQPVPSQVTIPRDRLPAFDPRGLKVEVSTAANPLPRRRINKDRKTFDALSRESTRRKSGQKKKKESPASSAAPTPVPMAGSWRQRRAARKAAKKQAKIRARADKALAKARKNLAFAQETAHVDPDPIAAGRRIVELRAKVAEAERKVVSLWDLDDDVMRGRAIADKNAGKDYSSLGGSEEQKRVQFRYMLGYENYGRRARSGAKTDKDLKLESDAREVATAIPADERFFRGMPDLPRENLEAGSVIEFGALTSTSRSAHVAARYGKARGSALKEGEHTGTMFVIETPKGSRGLFANSPEDEMTLLPGARVEIVKVERRKALDVSRLKGIKKESELTQSGQMRVGVETLVHARLVDDGMLPRRPVPMSRAPEPTSSSATLDGDKWKRKTTGSGDSIVVHERGEARIRSYAGRWIARASVSTGWLASGGLAKAMRTAHKFKTPESAAKALKRRQLTSGQQEEERRAQVNEFNNQINSLKMRVRELKEVPSASNRQTINSLEDRISTLMGKINELEK